MIEFSSAIQSTIRRFAPSCVILLLLTGCGQDEGNDYCLNHYWIHADHADSIAMLQGTLDAQGLLTMRLELPASLLGAGSKAAGEYQDLLESFRNPERVYSLETDQPCAAATVTANEHSQGLGLEYQSQCGAGNRIKQVNVELFGLLEDLEEVEVQMDTAATGKHFAISRLCKQAIFRLNPPGQR